MRCLVLADALAARGAEVDFVMRASDTDLVAHVESRGYGVQVLPAVTGGCEEAMNGGAGPPHAAWLGTTWRRDASQTERAIARSGWRPRWLVVDHYAIDALWERRLSAAAEHLLVIDDLADRDHASALLLDQNYSRQHDRYRRRVPAGCRCLLGPQYALLAEAYRMARQRDRSPPRARRRVVVFFGGIDREDLTRRALLALAGSVWRDADVDVVVGAGYPHRSRLEPALRAHPRAALHVQLPSLSQLFARADLSIGAGGTATWERCCLGVPSVVVASALNQIPTLEALAADGYVRYLGIANRVTIEDLVHALDLAADSEWLRRTGRACAGLVDGDGAARVADAMGWHSSAHEGCAGDGGMTAD